MSDLALVGRQGAFNIQGYLRSSRTVVFGLAMPVGFLLLFNSVFGKNHATTDLFGHRVPLTAFYSAGIAAYSVALNAFSGLLIGLVTDREGGRLKRYRGTPMPPWVFFGGQLIYAAAIAAGIVAVLTVISIVGYGVHIRPETLPAFVAYVALGVFSFSMVAIGLSGFVTTTEMASSVGPFSIVILGFISGVFLPVQLLPSWLHHVAQYFPLAPLAQGLQAVFTDQTGAAWRSGSLIVLAIWGTAGLAVARRTFRWPPIGNRSG